MRKIALSLFTATLAAQDVPASADVPESILLLPITQSQLRTFDGRWPYHVTDAQAVIAASFSADPRNEGGPIIDGNHSSELSAPKGGPSRSRGRTVVMEARADGIWGRVEWNAADRALMADQSYRGSSLFVIHDKAGKVLRIKNAALVNYPNPRHLTALNQESAMAPMEQLIAKLGLKAEATEADVLAACSSSTEAAQSAPAKTTVTAQTAEVVALQAELAQTATELKTIKESLLRNRATAFVDGAVKAGHVGVKPSRDHFIAVHMSDAAGCDAIIDGMQVLGPSSTSLLLPKAAAGTVALNAEEVGIPKALGKPPTEFAAPMAADRKGKESD